MLRGESGERSSPPRQKGYRELSSSIPSAHVVGPPQLLLGGCHGPAHDPVHVREKGPFPKRHLASEITLPGQGLVVGSRLGGVLPIGVRVHAPGPSHHHHPHARRLAFADDALLGRLEGPGPCFRQGGVSPVVHPEAGGHHRGAEPEHVVVHAVQEPPGGVAAPAELGHPQAARRLAHEQIVFNEHRILLHLGDGIPHHRHEIPVLEGQSRRIGGPARAPQAPRMTGPGGRKQKDQGGQKAWSEKGWHAHGHRPDGNGRCDDGARSIYNK
jgi:hypothetical protein